MGNSFPGDPAAAPGPGTDNSPGEEVQSCSDPDIRIARDGAWYYQGSPIARESLVKLFASVLRRDPGGKYWLETPAEKCPVRVDDAPFVAVEMFTEGSGRKQGLSFRTNVDDIVTAGHDNPLRVAVDEATGEPSPYIYVRNRLEALIARTVFYDLVALGVEERDLAGGTRFGVWSGGVFFPLDEAGEKAG